MNQSRHITQAIQAAPRCTLFNSYTGEWMDCLFNPAQLAEKVQVNYSKLLVPGLSHQVLHYQSTGNRQIPGLEFYLDRHFARKQSESADIMKFRRFLLAMTTPYETGSAPPVTQIIWPNVLSVDAVLTSVEFRYQKIGANGDVLIYTANCSFEEIQGISILSE